MLRRILTGLLLLVSLLPTGGHCISGVSISSPTISSDPLPSSADYATEVLGNPWDMNDANDLADWVHSADSHGITTPTFSGGVMSLSMTTDNGFLYLLAPPVDLTNAPGKNGRNFPIDTSKYRYLNVRMRTDMASVFQVLYNRRNNYFEDFCHTPGVATTTGWKTYTIDLGSIGCASQAGYNPAWSAAPVSGIRIEPSVIVGANVDIDWITLTAEPPADTHALSYSFNAGGGGNQHSLFLDDDFDPYNGVVKDLVVGASATQAISISSQGLYPGSYQVLAIEGHDFASLRRNPWDMASNDDIASTFGMSASASGGTFSGTTTNAVNGIHLNLHGYTIPTGSYRYLTFSLNVSSGATGFIIWYDGQGAFIGQKLVTINSGSHVYNVDLNSSGSWSGSPATLRLSFAQSSGVNFSIDYVSLRNDGYGGVDSTDLSGVVNSPAPLVINSPPALQFLQPDAAGGEDFASTVLGNPWDFGTSSDIYTDTTGKVRVHNVDNPRILPNNYIDGLQGNFYCASSIADNYDPYQISFFTTDPSKQIDTSRYKNLVYRLDVRTPQDLVLGSVVRIIWQGAGNPVAYYNTQDQPTNDGWRQYIQNMDSVSLEPRQHPDGSYPAVPWTNGGNAFYFRVDPHEFSTATEFCFDSIKLTAYDEAHDLFAITYTAVDTDSDPADVSISFYANTSATTSGGSLIGTASLADNTRTLLWDSSGVSAGTYWIYAVIDDGINSLRRLATGRLVVSHSGAADATAPVLVVTGPSEGSTLYNQFTARGYAVDNLQLASIEVSVDGNYLTSIIPENYDSAAYALYASYPDGSTAGFRSVLDITSVTAGAHQIEFKAIDTSGNQSVVTRNFTKVSSSDPSPEPTPGPYNADAVTIPTGDGPGGSVPVLTISGKLNTSKRIVSFSGQGGALCSSLKLIGGPVRSDVAAGTGSSMVLKSLSPSSRMKVNSRALKKRTKNKVYFAWKCGTSIASRVVSVSFAGLPVKNISSASKFVTQELSKRF